MEGKQVEELNQLEQVLGAPDAIMEPSILNVLRRYMSDGGNPATAVEMLSDNYTGMQCCKIGDQRRVACGQV